MADRPVLWTGRELAEALGVRWASPAGEAVRARGVCMSGEHEIGDIVLTAGDAAVQRRLLASGAAAVIAASAAKDLARAYAVIEVDDLEESLYSLAVAARARCQGRIVAITGSVGKSWVKQALGHALGLQGRTSMTVGNQNSFAGVAHALAVTPRDVDYGVYEIGMSKVGSVLTKARQVRPHVAVITAIASAHIVSHPNLESIADTKAEIFQGLEPGGTAVIPRDSEFYPRLLDAAHRAGVTNVLTFGDHRDASVRLVDCDLAAEGSDVTVELEGQTWEYRLTQAGRHLVEDSLAVVAAAHAVGADWRRVARDMSGARRMHRRGGPVSLRVPGGSIIVIDDTYNANPASMRAAIEVLALHHPPPGASRIAVLGDMALQGATGPEAHAGIAASILDSGVDCVITLGDEIRYTREALPAKVLGPHCDSPEAVRDVLLARIRPGDVVLFKGSIVTTKLADAVELLYRGVGAKPVPWG